MLISPELNEPDMTGTTKEINRTGIAGDQYKNKILKVHLELKLRYKPAVFTDTHTKRQLLDGKHPIPQFTPFFFFFSFPLSDFGRQTPIQTAAATERPKGGTTTNCSSQTSAPSTGHRVHRRVMTSKTANKVCDFYIPSGLSFGEVNIQNHIFYN